MRIFVDEQGTEWEVREIHVPHLSVVPRHLLPHPEYAEGWLLFTSESQRRRIAPFPADWLSLPADELARCCRCAVPARSAPDDPARRRVRGEGGREATR